MIIIPAIDIMDGQVVRLVKGEFSRRKDYTANPVSLAQSYKEAGFTHLHVVDLDAAKKGQPVNQSLIVDIVRQSGLCVDVGGGLKKEKDIAFFLENGVSAVNIGSLAVKNQEKTTGLIRKFGSERIYISLDLLGEDIRIHGWQEKAPVKWQELMQILVDGGAKTFVMTDISRDGLLSGVSKDFYKRILNAFPDIRLIASGGVSGLEDLRVLDRLGVYGAITGKALLEGRIKTQDLSEWLC
ncbi:TPA: 1-(5-phosphoribosyl)-5-[(5-phosphoribosylamino)methylideneamino]imidazole-4-carboxamide isomerase [Candidatus Marinimicrobia bacterium]|nr:MAG: 1-(5-phosphoribosyl)-5-[(5-phosphoribosylamino)methylideneamino] imidazole-4-carboxamide isomerase [Marinimicrobia bacterium 46_47]KUK92904.1 MAG: 1-(5-phosphoribosyl)-5-[(5-phosphoribosylamino)methylideneamino] imidazole-4-carboxamide isomerase [Marinimicrobia bacterium 46_43]HAE86826.1 1-(5-phosphoribosyl)-5-[(5-phosphoribosylamino)methylideneamino]imidazole-4-carboxamide isomerase [Candidatus Neomarinimicrobiota bacterium]HBY18052.1 1-(5-phosphoribosyl)-5-[(5-phosphoribosylamino)methy